MQEEKDFVKAATNGDIEAFSWLVKKYTNALYSVAYSVVGDSHLAQDIVQEVFIKVYSYISTLQSPDKFGSWMYAIAHRMSIDWKRKQKMEQTALEKSENTLFHHSLEEAVERRELQRDVWKALNKLEEKNRSTTILFHISGLSMKEIAEFLNISVHAVESRLHRSRQRIKKELMEYVIDGLQDQHLGPAFISKVSEEILKRSGQFYIPVADRQRSSEWYEKKFGLSLNVHGHLVLPSGQTVFLLETIQKQSLNTNGLSKPIWDDNQDSEMPLMSFVVNDVREIYHKLKNNGVLVSQIKQHSLLGKQLLFLDIDGNRFSIFEGH